MSRRAYDSIGVRSGGRMSAAKGGGRGRAPPWRRKSCRVAPTIPSASVRAEGCRLLSAAGGDAHPRAVAGFRQAGQDLHVSVASLCEEPVELVKGGPEGSAGEPQAGVSRGRIAPPAEEAVALYEIPIIPCVLGIEVEVRGHGGHVLHENAGVLEVI